MILKHTDWHRTLSWRWRFWRKCSFTSSSVSFYRENSTIKCYYTIANGQGDYVHVKSSQWTKLDKIVTPYLYGSKDWILSLLTALICIQTKWCLHVFNSVWRVTELLSKLQPQLHKSGQEATLSLAVYGKCVFDEGFRKVALWELLMINLIKNFQLH